MEIGDAGAVAGMLNRSDGRVVGEVVIARAALKIDAVHAAGAEIVGLARLTVDQHFNRLRVRLLDDDIVALVVGENAQDSGRAECHGGG